MGDKPDYRLIQKNPQTNKWDNCGGAWLRENGSFSVSIGKRGETPSKYLMVKNEEYLVKTSTQTKFTNAIPNLDEESEIPF